MVFGHPGNPPPPRCINFDVSLPTKTASLTLLRYRLSVSVAYIVMRFSRSIMCISETFRTTTSWPLSHRPSSYACPEEETLLTGVALGHLAAGRPVSSLQTPSPGRATRQSDGSTTHATHLISRPI